MPDDYDSFKHPLEARYASNDMKKLFSQRSRIGGWFKCWIWLIEAEKELGLPVTDEAIKQLKDHDVPTEEDFAIAAEEEARRRCVPSPHSN